MTDANTGLAITAGTALAVALVSGFLSLLNGLRTSRLKGTIDADLEHLKARLAHKQIISSTQWNAEFSSYQMIWKSMVEVRTLATKIAAREGELTTLGISDEYLVTPQRHELRKNITAEFGRATKDLVLAIHDSAPFYPASIRQAANEAHGAAHLLFTQQLKGMVQLASGSDPFRSEDFNEEARQVLLKLVDGVDKVELLIRERLSAVEVQNAGTS